MTVRSVDDVSSDFDGVVSSDGSRGTLGGVGFSQHLTSGEDGALALPHHGHDRTGGEVRNQTAEERLRRSNGARGEKQEEGV